MTVTMSIILITRGLRPRWVAELARLLALSGSTLAVIALGPCPMKFRRARVLVWSVREKLSK